MTSGRWARVKDALSLALKRPPGDRSALDDLCADPSVRRDVEELLACERDMGDFLEAPLIGGPADADDEDDVRLPPSLEQWTRYQVGGLLGRGGMAAVYKAWDPRLRRTVAVKVISNRDRRTVARFVREAEAQARVEHDHVLKIYETGVIGTHHYIAMQYVDGPTLLGVRGETTIEQKVELVLQVAEGLHAAHRQGLVHRDIKPGNILVERTAERLKPYVLDFGLAAEIGAPSLTQTGTVVGTPRYMAPERIHGGTATLDRRSDVYSLGATLYEFLAGAAPFPDSSGLQVLVDVLERDFPPLRAVQPTIAPELEAIVGKCLEKDPRLRYPSARALGDDLRRYLNGDTVSARPTGAIGRAVRKARRQPRLAAAFAALTALVVALAAWSVIGYWRASRQTALAQRLGEEIRDVEWLYRAAEMSPLHEMEPQRRVVRDRMARLERIMTEAGSIAIGPGRYAVGRAWLALGDHANALAQLNLAWQAGYRTADSAMALGLAHDATFRAEVAKAQRIENDRDRDAKIHSLEAAHRDSAVRLLEAGRSSALVPAKYVDALLASYRGDAAQVIAHADAAVRDTPWLFEARLLPADLAFKDAVTRWARRETAAAAARAEEADRYYAEAERIAPSAVEAYQGRCAAAGLLLHLIGHGLPQEAAATMRRADESCARAVLVEPSVDGYRLSAEALQAYAISLVLSSGDPREVFERATEFAGRALRMSPDDIDSRLALAGVFLNRAWWEERSGRDPRATIDRAVGLYAEVLAADPRNVSALGNRGQAFVLKGRYARLHQLDPLAAMDAAIADFEQALRLLPDAGSEYINLAREASGRADEQVKRGIDPRPGLSRILQFIEQGSGDRTLKTRADAIQRVRARLAASP